MQRFETDVYILSLIAVCTSAASTVALVAGLAWCSRHFRVTQEHTFLKWTGFQRLSFLSCAAGILLYLSSSAELVLVMYFAPENMSTTFGMKPGMWREGLGRIFVALTELSSQSMMSITVYCYFLILMERLAAFRVLLPPQVFRLIYTPIFVFGTILFLAMELSFVLINVLPLSDALVASVILCANSLIALALVIEWVLSIALCRTFFIRTSARSTRTETWTLGRRPVRENIDIGQFEDQDQKVDPLRQGSSTHTSASSVPSYPPPPLSSPKTLSLARSVDSRPPDYNSRTAQQPVLPLPRQSSTFVRGGPSSYTLREAFQDPDKRRTLLLFCGFLFTDLTGLMFYALGLFPSSAKMARPLDVMGRAAIGFHIVLALIFLDSFKEIIRPGDMSTRVLTG
ncbi:hypothetical protein BJ742DRAFT_840272 [Cladochytrium replicatum]|nr:hypothetical protein BJ742DRAFT_840272 [Cladochytrium replicatum]